jgi:hypothetical protein
VFILANNEDKEDGRLAKQFFRCTIEISADIAWLLRLLGSGAMIATGSHGSESGPWC